jgi:hypothetical protein
MYSSSLRPESSLAILSNIIKEKKKKRKKEKKKKRI